MDKPRKPNEAEKSGPSENEGQIMSSEGCRYLVQGGRRLWIDTPPKGWQP